MSVSPSIQVSVASSRRSSGLVLASAPVSRSDRSHGAHLTDLLLQPPGTHDARQRPSEPGRVLQLRLPSGSGERTGRGVVR